MSPGGQNLTWLRITDLDENGHECISLPHYACVFLYFEYGETVFPGVSSKAFLFGILHQNEEMERMLLRISYSLISFLFLLTPARVFFFLFLLRNKSY